MLIKLFFIVVFVFILISLGFALFHLVRSKTQDHASKTAKALTYRIGLSLLLLLLLFIAYALGMVKPQGISVNLHQPQRAQNVTQKAGSYQLEPSEIEA